MRIRKETSFVYNDYILIPAAEIVSKKCKYCLRRWTMIVGLSIIKSNRYCVKNTFSNDPDPSLEYNLNDYNLFALYKVTLLIS